MKAKYHSWAAVIGISLVLLVFSSCAFLQTLATERYHDLTINHNGKSITVKTPETWPDLQNIEEMSVSGFQAFTITVYQFFLGSNRYDIALITSTEKPVLAMALIDGERHCWIYIDQIPVKVEIKKWKQRLQEIYEGKFEQKAI